MTVKGSVLDRHVETLFSAYKIAESERPPPQAPPCAFLKEISDINGWRKLEGERKLAAWTQIDDTGRSH